MLSSSCLLRLQLSPVTLSSLPNLSTSGSHGSLSPLPKPSTFGTHAFHSIRRAPLPIRRRTHLPESRKWRELDHTCFYKPKDKLEASSSEKGGEVSLDEKAGILFAGQFTVTAVVLGVIYGITNTFQPLPDDLFRYDWKEPFNLRNGWILWAGIGLVGAIIAVALLGVALAIFNGEPPERETDALVRLLPLIGSSSTSTAFLIGITGVLAPVLEETVFRGFLMTSLTKWLPTPVSVFITGAVFALAHFTPGEFPQLFVLGSVLGFSYAQTRNLLTPITIHALWNSGVIILLTILQLQGYDIRELLQAS